MRKVLSKEVVLLDASKYTSISEWSKNSRSCYVVASRNGWLEEASLNMSRKRKMAWTESEILVDAARFERMIDWIENSPVLYQAAIKLGIIKDIKQKMLPRRKRVLKWTHEAIFADALLYEKRADWEKGSPGAVMSAQRYGIYKEATKHMPANCSIGKIPHNKKWTKEAVLEDAKRFVSIKEWAENSAAAYHVSLKNEWHDETTKHMPKYARKNGPEGEILEHVMKSFPDAKTKRFKNDSNLFSFKEMELDIFISSIKKGIEFDGTYWHRPEVLKRGRPNWREEDLLDYHLTKDKFFNLLGIQILHVKEESWENNKQDCLNKIDNFLRS